MKYIKFLVASVALILATACVTSEVDDAPIISTGSNGQLQVVGRITQYSDCDVATRSKKAGDESKVTSMGLALFPITNNGTAIGDCMYYDYEEGGSIVFIVDRASDSFKNYSDDQQFAMYIFANMQDATGFPTVDADGVGKSLAYFKQCAYKVPADVENVPASGFPMMGSLGDTTTGGDGKTLILKPAKGGNNPDGLPTIGGTPTDNLEIPLKAMYAKFTFTISSKPDQEIVGNKAPRFDLVKYTVHNLPATVDGDPTSNDDDDVIADSEPYTFTGKYAQGATTATFDFYLPERYLTPQKAINDVLPTELKKGTYGTDVDADQDGYRDEDERYHQRFKNKLVEGQAATYITIEGKYADHQGHNYDVSYNIYVGGNNTDNFDVIRNKHYINSIAIRGIDTSSDMADNENGISIDWRVEVNRKATPLVISFRREALLDAHYEVRPLRLRLVGENIPTGTSATVQVLNQDGTSNEIPNWIRLEESGTDGNTYITSGVSTGKRKYFTADLVTKTLAGNTSVTVEDLTGNNQAVWIYVDENTTTQSRAAIVRVSYQGVNKDYKIVQNGLFEVKSTDGARTYYIEQYEEYLYNYDAEDSYGQTHDEGMQWGLNGKQLSKEHYSFDLSLAPNVDWTDYEKKSPRPYFDFYIKKYDSFAESNGGKVREYPGQEFTDEISKNSNSGVTYRTMAEPAQSAVEYCYNRNKRNSDGTVDVQWYLPSADELEDFIVVAYSTFKEFQNNYYWTSQPAYIKNVFYYEYQSSLISGKAISSFTVYDDNREYARATKVIYRGNNQYDYVPSGLNTTPPESFKPQNPSNYTNVGYFYQMHYYKRYNDWGWKEEYGPDKTGVENAVANGIDATNGSYNEQYTHNRNNYYFHLGHLYNMIQKTEDGDYGYRPRTEKNRVRCVRVKPTQN